ncbi:glycosyltransferase family 2 protein [Candidatus Cloacimonadota bacterium]
MEFSGKLSIIIPCFNEEAVIEKTHKRVLAVLSNNNIESYEIVYINDGSKDRTFEILTSFSADNSKIKIIDLSRNFGHQAALSAGIHNCSGDIAIIIDADLQDPPELIPELIETYQKEKCNVVYCVRKKRIGETWLKKITAKIFYRVIEKICDTPIPKDTGDFRLIDREVMGEFKKLKEQNKFIRGLISWLGFKQVPFYFERENRKEGDTKYSVSKMLKFALNGITYFSDRPLFWAFKLAIINLFLFITSVVVFFFLKSIVPISAELFNGLIITVIFFLSGLNFFIFGIMGVYLKNVFDELKDRPEFIIREIING